MAVYIEMVELVPEPDWIEVLVEIDHYITNDRGRSGISRQIGKLLGDFCHHQDVAVGQQCEIVAEDLEFDIEIRRSEFCI